MVVRRWVGECAKFSDRASRCWDAVWWWRVGFLWFLWFLWRLRFLDLTDLVMLRSVWHGARAPGAVRAALAFGIFTVGATLAFSA